MGKDKSPDALVGPPDWNKRPHLESREQFLERTADYWGDKSERLQCELQDERAKLRAARAELGMVRGKCDRLQAKIDALMLEYCPDEMTREQTNRWAAAAMAGERDDE